MTGLATAVAAVAVLAGGALAQTDTIRIGVIKPITGPLAFDGNNSVNGAKLAVDEINAKGGVLGKKLELVVEDGQCKPADSVTAAEKLMVRDKVPVVMGAFCSGATLAVMPVAERNKVPLITGVSSSPKLTEAKQSWFFRNAESELMTAQAFAAILYEKMGLKNIYYLAVNDDWGRGTVGAFKETFEKIGAKTMSIEYVDRTANDFYTPLTKIRAANPDVVIVVAETQAGSIITKQARELGLKSKIFGVGAWATPTFMNLAGDAANGVFAGVVYASTATGDANKMFVDNFKKVFNTDPGKYSAGGYTTINVIAQAIARAGAAEPDKIREALTKTDVQAPNGRIKFDSHHQAYGWELVLVELKDKVPHIRATGVAKSPYD
ncbi:MAG: amino acid ABC transporter substrate-binding protein [Alphaproteobacteria bacterium]|nr:amino acid ABC transporter substrate-binding protein [Alphaproteobacteria bacterium]